MDSILNFVEDFIIKYLPSLSKTEEFWSFECQDEPEILTFVPFICKLR